MKQHKIKVLPAKVIRSNYSYNLTDLLLVKFTIHIIKIYFIRNMYYMSLTKRCFCIILITKIV